MEIEKKKALETAATRPFIHVNSSAKPGTHDAMGVGNGMRINRIF
jgi:hypothetical protein